MEDENGTEKMEVEDIDRNIEYNVTPDELLYRVSDRPPLYLTAFLAFQQALLPISASLAVSSFVADVACASDFADIKTSLLSSTLLMNGVTTLMMVTLGIRLPLYQGPSDDYVSPLLALQLIDKDFCKVLVEAAENTSSIMEANSTVSFQLNTTNLDYTVRQRDFAFSKLREFQGCLILVGIAHCLIGMTGTVGFLLKYIGPVTIVPTILLGGIFLSRATVRFAKCHWGVTATTTMTALVLSMYLGHKKMPFPTWSRKRGFHIYWYPLHQVFSILIGMLVGWGVSAVLTYSGKLTSDPDAPEFLARTDARAGLISNSAWLRVPYPNQFGTPTFSIGVFIAFATGTIISILDSIGDYYACAKICKVPPPPRHGINRGIAIEGFCSALSGVLGCGHATTTYGGNIGAIGVTKVASRYVFIGVAAIYILFGIVGKVSAVFITIPYPVLGGAMIVMYGIFNGVVLSNLSVVSLSSTRNLAIIGTALLIGLMIPYWLERFPHDLDTGSTYYNNLLKTLLGNPGLSGGVVACLLDNTVRGTDKERGISAWRKSDTTDSYETYSDGFDVYTPLFPSRLKTSRIMKYIPIFPYNQGKGSSKD